MPGQEAAIIPVIVTLNPDVAKLGMLVHSLLLQTSTVLVVDNSTNDTISQPLLAFGRDRVALLRIGRNLGIASAQNAGIAWAREHGASHVLLFDQDSIPPPDLVARLSSGLAALQSRGERVAAVGTNFIDTQRSGGSVPTSFRKLRDIRIVDSKPPAGCNFASVDFLAASGSLIPMTALDEIGLMQDNLFIDYVDIEWGLRARQMGWAIYGVMDAVMQHSMGDNAITRFGISIPVHSPTRHYYVTRNATWLALHSNLRPHYRICLAYNGLRRLVVYALFMPDRMRHIRFMFAGVWDGAIGRLAELDRKL